MNQEMITLIINGNTYRLSARDDEAIRQMPSADRKALKVLLESVSLQDKLAEHAIESAAAVVRPVVQNVNAGVNAEKAMESIPKPERLGSGDIDELMARLVIQEKMQKKPPLQARQIYTWAGGFLLIIAIIVYIF